MNDILNLTEKACQNRNLQVTLAKHFIEKGVNIIDINRVDFREKLQPPAFCDDDINKISAKFNFGKEVVVDINVIFIGKVTVGNNVQIGANCILENCEVGDNTVIEPFSYIVSAQIGANVKIGPFARIRPGTVLANDVHIGNFVEVKNCSIGAKSKANHLSYLGDTDIGARVNVGAGVITCNYDGVNKFRTTIEDEVFIGSDSQLVAPVTIGKGATIGAGTTLTKNAPAQKLTLSRAQQTTINNWQQPTKILKK